MEAAREYEQDIEGDLWHISYSVEGASQSAAEQPGIEKTGELITSLSTGFVDSSIPDRGDLRPELVYNNSREGVSVLTRLLDELRDLKAGDEFWFVVAFVKLSGIQLLLQTFDELEKRGVRGRIITGTYLTFSEPGAFKRLMRYSNIETHVYNSEHAGLHVKSYFFIKRGVTTLVTGSSNLTQYALKNNMEWNVALSSTDQGSLVESAKNLYEQLWNAPETSELTDDFLADYTAKYKAKREREKKAKIIDASETTAYEIIKPNKMQERGLRALRDVRRDGEPRALVISATGTGKTYLSALDVKQFEPTPKRVLFIVHRGRIARAALKSYQRVLGDRYTYGLLSGGHRDFEVTALFSTVQSLARQENLARFAPDAFDYIVIDEVHRAGARSYQKVVEYFKPKFLLGMSATPERSDSFDVFALFNHVVPFEIRLSDALDNHLVTPFHYFGVSAGEGIGDNQVPDPETLAAQIIEQSDKYGYSGPRLKCLVFCSRVREADEVAERLRAAGRRALSLAGSSSDDERERAISRLEQDEDAPDSLEFLLSIDIFNEGIDIPTVNQVILARPTQSAIVFVQQLGRGLRIDEQKEFVTVIDFVGNYKSNYNIPVALYGDRSLERENLRRLVADGGNSVTGPTVIQFDEIARKNVLESVNTATLSTVSTLRCAYRNLRMRLGRIPSLADFAQLGEVSPRLVFENKSLGCYHMLLAGVEKEYTVSFSEDEVSYLRFISNRLADGKRPTELIVLRELMRGNADHDGLIDCLRSFDMLSDFGVGSAEHYERELESARRIFSLEFFDEAAKRNLLPVINEDDWTLTPRFVSCFANPEFSKQVGEVIEYGKELARKEYAVSFDKNIRLCLGERYTRADFCRLACWDKDEHGTINGYSFKTNDWPIFVTYHKSDDASQSVRYEDEFESPSRFIWFSQNNRSFGSKDYAKLRSFDSSAQRIHLFVKKDDSEGSDHYYLGTLSFDLADVAEEKRPNSNGEQAPILRVPFTLNQPVARDTYRYLMS